MNNLGNEHEMNVANNYVNDEQLERRKWKVINNVPGIIFAKVGAAIMLNRKRLIKVPFLMDNNTMEYAFDRSWNVYFGKTLFETLNLPKYAQVGALPSYNGSDIETISVEIPEKDEQERIGTFFQRLDQLITVNQRKVDLLKELKKGFLQKMFPKNGEDKPEIRFAGYTDAWEKRKLSDVVKITSGVTGDSTLQKGQYKLTRIESIAKEILNPNKFGFINEKPDSKYLLNLGDILYSNINSLNHIGKVALVDIEGVYHGINLLRFQLRSNFSSNFVFQDLKTLSMKNWAVSHANPAVSQASINQTELSKQPMKLPLFEEQMKIGDFLRLVDQLITVNQRRVDLLKQEKKALLQKMFV